MSTAIKLRLYHYWRSSSSWRVRWALALKGLDCEFVTVSLLDDETDRPEHRSRNPMGYVPVLELLDAPEAHDQASRTRRYLTESLAILEWLEEKFPKPSLLPSDLLDRAHVRRLCELINSGIQPLQNPPVFSLYSKDPAEQKKWNQHWIRNGLAAYSEWIQGTSGEFSFGNQLTLADLCLIPQCHTALRFEVDLETEFPALAKIYAHALKLESCQASHSDRFKPPGQ